MATEMIRLHASRYAGQCNLCGTRYPANTDIWWDSATKLTFHADEDTCNRRYGETVEAKWASTPKLDTYEDFKAIGAIRPLTAEEDDRLAGAFYGAQEALAEKYAYMVEMELDAWREQEEHARS